MTSTQWPALCEAYTASAPKTIAAVMAASRGVDLRGIDGAYSLAAEPTAVTYEETEVAGIAALRAAPIEADAELMVVYFHGGGFISGSKETHRKLAGHLAKVVGAPVLVPDYRLAPEHPFPAQVEDARAIFRALLDGGHEPGQIALAGDSAGGYIAVAAALGLVRDGESVPAGLVAFSPWFDLAAEGATFDSHAGVDIAISRELADGTSPLFLGGYSATDPEVNLMYADLAGLPPAFLTCGSHETLLDSVERFADSARHSGVDVTLQVADELPHVYQLLAGRLREADASISEAGAWLLRKLHS